jgi:general secretion pathway protein G
MRFNVHALDAAQQVVALTLDALVVKPANESNWTGPYLKKAVPNDPWGRPYVYRVPGSKGDFDLYSLGKDGKPGGSGEDADIGLNTLTANNR